MKRLSSFCLLVLTTALTSAFVIADDATPAGQAKEENQIPSQEAAATKPIMNLIDTEQSIEGVYTGNCLDTRSIDNCWQRITAQAAADLRQQLEQDYGDTRDVDLVYVDFEGRQRDQYQDKRLEMTADGRFFFLLREYKTADEAVTTITIHRREEIPEPVTNNSGQTETTSNKDNHQKTKDPFDVALSFAWDGNDRALNNDLAISSERWGLGVWANNRLGFLAFLGTDTLGIGDEDERVINSKKRYQTMGVGLGFRLWDTRSINVENALYYVDAKPFEGNINPNCSTCEAIDFTAEDYLQATVTIKTNSRGVNLGWMFTWKALENTQNTDALSSGFYLEAQF